MKSEVKRNLIIFIDTYILLNDACLKLLVLEYLVILLKITLINNQGVEFYSYIIRDGKEIAYISNNKFYDFEFQFYNFLQEPVTLQKVSTFFLIDNFSNELFYIKLKIQE